jgi:hypothetical protein
MTVKKKTAILWKHNGYYGITLHLPLAMIKAEEGKLESGFEKITDVTLPEPMTSHQFNQFITSDKGEAWYKPILEEQHGTSRV